jgi:hypothetical protein
MALPTSYLTSTKRLPEILDALKTAKAPDKFTQKFLETLEFKAKGDRLIIGVLKELGLIDDTGKPTDRYYHFIDQSQSATVLAAAIEEAYEDLFAVNRQANELAKPEIMGKFKTLSQGQYSDAVIDKMSSTFTSLVSLADFKSPKSASIEKQASPEEQGEEVKVTATAPQAEHPAESVKNVKLGGLVYNIQIVLPETRDPKVYDALFRSLKEHLI